MPVVRARDLRANISELGFERGVTATLELLLEEHGEDRQRMRELVELVEMCIRQIEAMVQVGTGMKEVIESIQSIMRGEPDAD